MFSARQPDTATLPRKTARRLGVGLAAGFDYPTVHRESTLIGSANATHIRLTTVTFRDERRRLASAGGRVKMIVFSKVACIAPGKAASALGHAHEVVAYIKSTYGVDVEILLPIGGNPARVAWSVRYKDLAAYEAVNMKMRDDKHYGEMLSKNSDNFLPGSTGPLWKRTSPTSSRRSEFGDSSRSQVATADRDRIAGERLHPKVANWRCRPISAIRRLRLLARQPPFAASPRQRCHVSIRSTPVSSHSPWSDGGSPWPCRCCTDCCTDGRRPSSTSAYQMGGSHVKLGSTAQVKPAQTRLCPDGASVGDEPSGRAPAHAPE
jgi:hypothetical protein